MGDGQQEAAAARRWGTSSKTAGSAGAATQQCRCSRLVERRRHLLRYTLFPAVPPISGVPRWNHPYRSHHSGVSNKTTASANVARPVDLRARSALGLCRSGRARPSPVTTVARLDAVTGPAPLSFLRRSGAWPCEPPRDAGETGRVVGDEAPLRRLRPALVRRTVGTVELTAHRPDYRCSGATPADRHKRSTWAGEQQRTALDSRGRVLIRGSLACPGPLQAVRGWRMPAEDANR